MPDIHVCSLERLSETIEKSNARSVVSLVSASMDVPYPLSVPVDQRLRLNFNDIVVMTPGLDPPEKKHAEELIRFIDEWDGNDPLVIHCWMGVSRSTAAAYIALCQLLPEADEMELAQRLREASPTATPNIRLVQFADDILGRDSRMILAIDEIGRGEDCFESEPFHLAIAS